MIDGWEPTPIKGVVRRQLLGHEDERGGFSELWRASWTEGLTPRPFVQSNLSRSRRGVLRGMHFHLRQADLWVVLDGRVRVGLADLRDARDDPSWRPRTALLALGRGEALYIPERVAHGFYAPEQLSLLYLVTNEFDGSDEHGFAWDDPVVGLHWPARKPVLSARDSANPSLSEAVAPLGQGQIAGA